mgnify:CR=1 FL=1
MHVAVLHVHAVAAGFRHVKETAFMFWDYGPTYVVSSTACAWRNSQALATPPWRVHMLDLVSLPARLPDPCLASRSC